MQRNTHLPILFIDRSKIRLIGALRCAKRLDASRFTRDVAQHFTALKILQQLLDTQELSRPTLPLAGGVMHFPNVDQLED